MKQLLLWLVAISAEAIHFASQAYWASHKRFILGNFVDSAIRSGVHTSRVQDVCNSGGSSPKKTCPPSAQCVHRTCLSSIQTCVVGAKSLQSGTPGWPCEKCLGKCSEKCFVYLCCKPGLIILRIFKRLKVSQWSLVLTSRSLLEPIQLKANALATIQQEKHHWKGLPSHATDCYFEQIAIATVTRRWLGSSNV